MNKNFTLAVLFLSLLQFSIPLSAKETIQPCNIAIKDNQLVVQQIADNWNFYWNVFIDPRLVGNTDSLHATKVTIPSYWSSYSINGVELPGSGYGSFSTTVILPKDYRQPIGISVPIIDVAYCFFVNGQLLSSGGKIGKSYQEEEPGYSPELIRYTPASDTLHLLFYVSNFHHRRGGIWKGLSIGPYSKLNTFEKETWAIDFISLGILFAFGVFFLIFSFYNREEKSLPFLSMAFLFVLLRGICTNHFPIMLFADFSWKWMIRLEYIGNFGAIIMGMWGFFYIKPIRWIRQLLWFFSACLFFVLLAIIGLDVPQFAYSIYLFNIYLGTFFVLFCCQLFYIIKASEKFPWLFFAGVCLVTFAALNDLMIAFAKNLLFGFYILPTVFIVFVFILSIGFFRRFYQTYEREKLLSKELTALTVELESIVEKRTSQVSEKNKIIESQNATLQEDIHLKNRILSIIGHDIRSPLSFVIMGLDLVSDKNLSEKNRKTFIDRIVFAANNLFLLIDNLLSWGLSQNKQLKLFPEMNDLTLLVERVVDQFLHFTENKEIQIIKHLPYPVQAHFDENTVIIIIRNLLSNALKFTSRQGTVTVSIVESADYVEVSVVDSGVGIPADKLALLNTGSELVSSEGTDHEKGTGLGLILCKELIGLNGGVFSVHSEVGVGSTFSFTLPKSEPV
jgi:signal transduction histidine kinase